MPKTRNPSSTTVRELSPQKGGLSPTANQSRNQRQTPLSYRRQQPPRYAPNGAFDAPSGAFNSAIQKLETHMPNSAFLA